MTAPTEQIKSATEIKVSPEEATPSDSGGPVLVEAPLPTIAVTYAPALPSFGPEFETLSCISEDGFGSLYRVRNVPMDKEFAIRFIGSKQFTDDQAKKSFLRFCRRSVTVNHPALVPIYSFNESEDGVWMLSELRTEPSLEELIDKGEFKGSGKVLDVFEQLIDCLEALQQVGIRFGATKPGSIIVSQSPQGARLLLRDWWASALIQVQKDTTESSILGYASPEQLQDTGKLDVRSDIYGFGAILYEAMTGRLPHIDSNPVKLAIKILNGEIAPVEGPLASSSVAKIALVCLNKDPARRYQSLDDLHADFKAARRGSALPSDKAVSTESWAKRHPTRLMLLAVTAMVLMVNIVINQDFDSDISYPDVQTTADVAEGTGDMAGAEAILQASVDATPSDADVRYNLGRIQLQNNKYVDAEKTFKEVIRLDPAYSSAHAGLGRIYCQLGQLPESEAAYKQAIELNPSFPSFYSGLALTYIHAGKAKDAVSSAQALVKLAPGEADSHYLLAFANDEAKDYVAAARGYEFVLAMDPVHVDTLAKLSHVYSHLREHDKAIAAARQAVDILPAAAERWTALAHAYLRAGKLSESEKFYRKALAMDPFDGKAMSGLAETLKKGGKKAEAKQFMRRLVD